MIADLEIVTKKLAGLPKLIKNQNKDISQKAKALLPVLEKCKASFEVGQPADLTAKEKSMVAELNLITAKPVLYVCNVDEDALAEDNDYVKRVKAMASDENVPAIKICGKLESEIAALEDDEEKLMFLESAGLEESGIESLTNECYRLLGLKTFFTAGPKEVRAWTFREGSKAPEAAGIIHSDFERGFIKAEVYHCEDLFAHLSETKIKEKGKMRIEGKEYIMHEGDVVHFRFNV